MANLSVRYANVVSIGEGGGQGEKWKKELKREQFLECRNFPNVPGYFFIAGEESFSKPAHAKKEHYST